MILQVSMKDRTYDVVIKRNSLDNIEQYIDLKGKVLIVTDNGVPYEYVSKVLNKCDNGFVYTIEQGEESKNFSNFEKILNYMIENTFLRTDSIIAIGGGVVGDLAGFVASTYMRGINFYNIPTTLLSQVDSSIGGKTAIDKCGIKNIVGAFYPPMKVVIDPNVLSTLTNRQFNAGLVEAYKMGLTSDKSLATLIKQSEDIKEDIDEVIIKALNVKLKIVQEDPNEKGIRKILNFGHTVGHAIESSNKFDLLHGECVGIGMTYFASEEVKEEIISVLKKYNLPYYSLLSKDELFKFVMLDKKRTNNYLNIIYVSKIGECEIRQVESKEIINYS